MNRRLIIGVIVLIISLFLIGIFVISSFKRSSPKEGVSVNQLGSSKLQKDMLLEAEKLIQSGDYLGAKTIYLQILEKESDTNRIEQVKKGLEDLNMKIIFSPTIDDCSIEYVVKPKDVLIKIAKNFGTTVEMIKKINGLSSDIIKPGQKLKIYKCKFSILVDKSLNRLYLKSGEEIIKTYIVSTGKNNSTPTGKFKVINKLVKPTWYRVGAVIPPDSPENILGTRWIGLDIQGYGIHGTTEPDQLGTQNTLGCIRMKNEDVEELYDMIPLGTQVEIMD